MPVESPSASSVELLGWRQATIRAVAPENRAHSIHSYFNACPESPDGRSVLYFHSTERDGHRGQLRILDRHDGTVRILKDGIVAEDAHRVACQQWVAGGTTVAYHDFRDGRWVVAAVDPASGRDRILAEGRQIGFGASTSPWVPIYGPHWKQDRHRGLELVHALTGEIREVLSIEEVLDAYPSEIRRLVGEGEVSVFFPVMSPDGNKVFFKMARGAGGDDFRSAAASVREGKFVYDIPGRKFIRQYDQWGHPAWAPDSSGIIEKGNRLFRLDSNEVIELAPNSPSDHPSFASHGRLFVTDASIFWREGGRPGEWAVVVGSVETGDFIAVARFTHADGAASWRIPHPHPVFSGDGRRIYFNISSGGFTRLHVASLPEATTT